MFGATCRTCIIDDTIQWEDKGRLHGICHNKCSDHCGLLTRYDFGCMKHPLIIIGYKDTIIGSM